MRARVLSVLTASVLCLAGTIACPAIAGEGSDQGSVLRHDGSKITWGIDIGWLSAMHQIDSYGGPWIGLRVARDMRIRLRLLGDSWGMDYSYPDSAAYDWEHMAVIALDYEYSGAWQGQTCLPVGLTIGFERAFHRFRRVPGGQTTKQTDSHALLEPWIGLRAAPTARLSGWKTPLRILSLAVGYRFPISTHLPGYTSQDLTGAVLYIRIGSR
jgi:hypothetical protein